MREVHVGALRPRLEEDSTTVRAVIDSMGEGLIAIDAEGFITAVNPYALKALGYNEDELMGHWYSGVITAVDQYQQPLDNLSRPVVRALTTGEAISEQTYYLRKDGSVMPIFLTVSPILIAGRPSGVIELFRDMTTDKQLDVAKDDFVSLASHQLRTPASGVQAILSMILDEDFGTITAIQRKHLRKAMQANQRQLQIIEDILNTARIDSGKMELEPIQVNLTELIWEVLAEQTPQFELRDQQVSFQTTAKSLVWADKKKLRMVLDNLLSNASKYTPPGGQIRVSLEQTNGWARIAVEDTGVGISPDDLPRLFKKFSRIDNDLSTLVGGSGLGLYVAKSIVLLHQGELTATSKEGQGSCFCVTLPIKLK